MAAAACSSLQDSSQSVNMPCHMAAWNKTAACGRGHSPPSTSQVSPISDPCGHQVGVSASDCSPANYTRPSPPNRCRQPLQRPPWLSLLQLIIAVAALGSSMLHPVAGQVEALAPEVAAYQERHFGRSGGGSIPGSPYHPAQMVACVNEAYTPRSIPWEGFAMNNDSKTHESVGMVRALGAWWSTRNSSLPVTVVTQLSLNRLGQLAAQCRGWNGPLSAVVYTYVLTPPEAETGGALSAENVAWLRRAVVHARALSAYIAGLEKACSLDLLLVYEAFSEPRAAQLYPYNVLRNLARLQSRTPVSGFFDVDMLVSETLVEWLHAPGTAKQLLAETAAQNVFVVTAFEPNNTANSTVFAATEADRQTALSKADLVKELHDQKILAFHLAHYPEGHNWTLYDKWEIATEPYTVPIGTGYEPWVLLDRDAAPWHDVRFRGYGSDKIVHINALNASGFTFRVLPTAFLIHRAHKPSRASTTFFAGFKAPLHLPHDGRDMVEFNHAMLYNARDQMIAGTYEPAVDKGTLHCRSTLPWWKGWKPGPSAATALAKHQAGR